MYIMTLILKISILIALLVLKCGGPFERKNKLSISGQNFQ